MATQPMPHHDLAHEIKIDHDNIRDLFERFKAPPSTSHEDKASIVHTLVPEISVHTQAEELVILKALRGKGMRKQTDQIQHDHVEVDRHIATLDDLGPAAANFDELVHVAVEQFLEHAVREEKEYLPALLGSLTEEQNSELTREFLKARTTVPVHPHVLGPHSGGPVQRVLGAIEKVTDQIVDKIPGIVRGQGEYVEIEHTHNSTEYQGV